MNRLVLAALLLVASAASIAAPAGLMARSPHEPSAGELRSIRQRVAALETRIEALRGRADVDPDLLVDVEIYAKAGAWFLRFPGEVYHRSYPAKTIAALDRGLARADALARGEATWPAAAGRLCRGYRSSVDSSVQPYGLVVPASYDGSKTVRLDVVLHGRNGKLTEASFLAKHDSGKAVPVGQRRIELHVFGRTNNAYRWAGETDVHEALASVRRRYRIDATRVVLRGFSMGGAGAWHLGLHHPHLWAAVEAGAGFSETQRYARLPELPPHQLSALRIYDAADYSLNAFNVPIVGYGGEIDKQLQASVNIREQLVREGFRMTKDGLDWRSTTTPAVNGADLRALFLVGPRTGHKFHPTSKKKSERFLAEQVARARPQPPDRIRFVTYTTRYGRCGWVSVTGLLRHYERAETDARIDRDAAKAVVSTRNVSRLSLDLPAGIDRVEIDGTRLDRTAGSVGVAHFERRAERWHRAAGGAKGLVKRPGLQGPIDDAFTSSFVTVVATAKPLHRFASDHGAREHRRLRSEFARWLRGDIRTVEDGDVSLQNATDNLILFGDPSSNRLIGEALEGLPIHWDDRTIEIGGSSFDASEHVPVLIYPNPGSPDRYIVINSGHTFGAREFRGTNAYLFPRLGDWAVLKRSGKGREVVAAGFFDESWQPR